jgi:hypothetical protein
MGRRVACAVVDLDRPKTPRAVVAVRHLPVVGVVGRFFSAPRFGGISVDLITSITVFSVLHTILCAIHTIAYTCGETYQTSTMSEMMEECGRYGQ